MEEGRESLQRQGEPSGSSEVKKINPLGSMNDRISKDIRLSTYSTAEDYSESWKTGMETDQPLP